MISDIDFMESKNEILELIIANIKPIQLSQMSIYDWSFLAQGAATKSGIYRGNDDSLALKWSKVAVYAYERCAEILELVSFDQLEMHELSAARVRVWMIQYYGSNSQDYFLNPAVLKQWFSERAPISHVSYRTLLSTWPTSDSEIEFKILRLRERCQVLMPLLDQGLFGHDSEIHAWLQILEISNPQYKF